MKILLDIKSLENIGEITEEEKANFVEIFEALISSGGLTGVKGGKTIIHFDFEGIFMGISLEYFPWRRRKKEVVQGGA